MYQKQANMLIHLRWGGDNKILCGPLYVLINALLRIKTILSTYSSDLKM